MANSDGVGRTAASWGLVDDRSKELEVAFFAGATERVQLITRYIISVLTRCYLSNNPVRAQY